MNYFCLLAFAIFEKLQHCVKTFLIMNYEF